MASATKRLHQPYSSSEERVTQEEASQPNSSLSLISEPKKKKMKKSKNNNSTSKAKQQQGEEKKKSTDKRNCDEEDIVTKKSTQNYTTDEEEKKNNKRIWSEEDEITILEGLADFTSSTTQKGKGIGIKKFFNQKKDALQLNATYTQIRHKITKLRIKYEKNVKKLNNGVNRSSVFSKPHKLKLFCLSQKDLGNSNDDKNILESHLGSCFVYNYNDVVKRGIEMIEKSGNQKLKQKLEELKLEEMKLILMRSEINKELSLLIMEANFTAN